MAVPEIRWVSELQRCDVKPGDKFVLSIPQQISQQQAAVLQEQWKQFMGGDVPLLILSPGMKIGVFGEVKE